MLIALCCKAQQQTDDGRRAATRRRTEAAAGAQRGCGANPVWGASKHAVVEPILALVLNL